MGTITGTVIDKTMKQPIEEAVITLSGKATGRLIDIAQLTNEEGSFIWKDLAPGHYTILVVAEGYGVIEKQVTIRSQEEQDVIIEVS